MAIDAVAPWSSSTLGSATRLRRDDAQCAKKCLARPSRGRLILCVGENITQRDPGKTESPGEPAVCARDGPDPNLISADHSRVRAGGAIGGLTASAGCVTFHTLLRSSCEMIAREATRFRTLRRQRQLDERSLPSRRGEATGCLSAAPRRCIVVATMRGSRAQTPRAAGSIVTRTQAKLLSRLDEFASP